MKLEIELPLVEEAVWLALRDEKSSDFHARREALYEIADPEQRGRAFAELARAQFERLGLCERLEALFAERPSIAASVELCTVSEAPSPRAEGAELYVQDHPNRPTGPHDRRLHVRLRPESLIDPAFVRSLLRRELLHVADMLDPTFGYEPRLPPSATGPTFDRLVLDRYSALWSTAVMGRLVESGMLCASARAIAWQGFATAFPSLVATEAAFVRLFSGPRPTHAELVRISVTGRMTGAAEGSESETWQCPLCAIPVQDSREAPGEPVASRIRADFPSWQPGAGACLRCRELYESPTQR